MKIKYIKWNEMVRNLKKYWLVKNVLNNYFNFCPFSVHVVYEAVLLVEFPTKIKIFNDSEQPGKVHIFREGHKILQNLPLTFDCMCCSQKQGEDFAKFCGLFRIYELYSELAI